MSGNQFAANIKNYQFVYPSVAVWQDFNDLNLQEPKKEQKSGKRLLKGRKLTDLPEASFSEQKAINSGKMKRKNQPIGRSLGVFIRPSEFALDHSVLLPSSRAGIRLKPIKNAPVPKVDEKNRQESLPTVPDKPKFRVSEEKKQLYEEQKRQTLKPMPSWNPPEIRENTELAKEPSLYLDLNYGSDGDIDLVDVKDSQEIKSKRQPVKSKSNKGEIEEKLNFPEIDQDSSNASKDCKDLSESLNPDVMDSNSDQLDQDKSSSFLQCLPKLDGNSDEKTAPNFKKNTNLQDKKIKNSKNRTLPYIRASKGATKTTARYTVKSRYMNSKTRATKPNEIQPPTKNEREFLVGGGKQLKKSVNLARKSKANADQNSGSLFVKRKHTGLEKDVKPAKQEVITENLPSIYDESLVSTVSSKCEEFPEENFSNMFEENPDGEKPLEDMEVDEISSSPRLPSLNRSAMSAKLEEFESAVDEKRITTPRLLEYPVNEMKKYQKETYEQKRAMFRKLDIDGDGHLSLFELMKSFPAELTKYQIDYLKMIYQKACSSTFFGLEEFLCVDEMCSTMIAMSEELQAVFSKIVLRDLQAKLDDYLLMFLKAYDTSNETAVFQGFLERANIQSDRTNLRGLLTLFKDLNKDLNKGIRKPEFLLMLPFFLEKDILPEILLN